MDYTGKILELYNNVYDLQTRKYYFSGSSFRSAIQEMKEAYLPNPQWRENYENKMANYNNPVHRCAYLHKYAMLHTGLLCEILQLFFSQSIIRRELESKEEFNLCSLGGGPGTDIVSLLLVLQELFGFVKCNASIIDLALEWKQVFEDIVSELKTGRYGQVGSMVSNRNFSYEYFNADILNQSLTLKNIKMVRAVNKADIITMIKFISAVACDKTKPMVKSIFRCMKPGALLLFVDNAGGGFDQMIREAARECEVQLVFCPLQHYDYENPRFGLKRCGYTSQVKTKVTVEVFQKPLNSSYNTTRQLQREYALGPSRRRAEASADNIRLDGAYSEDTRCCSII